MHKNYNEIKQGDVFITEYGDYDNYVEIVFEDQEIEYKEGRPIWRKTIGHYNNNKEKKFEGYAPVYNKKIPGYKVIGKEINGIYIKY